MIIAYDFGTGGIKASLFDGDGVRIVSRFEHYETLYPGPGLHEQRPVDWWNAVVQSTRHLIEAAKECGITPETIVAIAISGHSLGCVPLDKAGNPLRETTPIWSDSRASKEASVFFERSDPDEWYRRTGNGFPAAHYTLFKILWYKNNEPAVFSKIDTVLGTKDYVNFRLTGVRATDFSYASGSGAYDLAGWQYDEEMIALSGLPRSIFPEIAASTTVLGPLTREAAAELGLTRKTVVVCGGVDNSCMALGAGCFLPGRLYASLGSSSWIAVVDSKPLLDLAKKPYVFTHVVPGQFTSALAIFSAGTTFRWLRDHLCRDLLARAESENRDAYELMIEEAERDSKPGANGVLLNPSFGGGSALDASPAIRGAFLGLDLSHTRSDLIRATMEGIALNLRLVLDAFRGLGSVDAHMNVVGGGAISPAWRQIYADVLRIAVARTNIGQDAAALGAAALATVGCGVWTDFSRLDSVLAVEDVRDVREPEAVLYDRLLMRFQEDSQFLAGRGDDHSRDVNG